MTVVPTVRAMGKAENSLLEEVKLVKGHPHTATIQHEDEETKLATIHVNMFNRILTELAPQNLNFEEEVKALALLSSLPTSWEVFCASVANNSPKVTLKETMGMALSKEIQRKFLGLFVDDTT